MNSNYYQGSVNPDYRNQVQNPFHYQQEYRDFHTQQLKHHTLTTVGPVVNYGLQEAQMTSYPHAMREVAAISYLMGRGYNFQTARQLVESWEINEAFYR
ncbi:hypothetical protein [Peribacillus glennii]|uniref:Uncharacterized protein n=1 Tax=Peribacillus glennii TaxID=2303991 RepID=A0A372L9E1_9BACI|nr:hypothetical protein [Peribacillus glennii]RFU61654.1 hypothetical protein D0466_17825 [Peribacillus glennii]